MPRAVLNILYMKNDNKCIENNGIMPFPVFHFYVYHLDAP